MHIHIFVLRRIAVDNKLHDCFSHDLCTSRDLSSFQRNFPLGYLELTLIVITPKFITQHGVNRFESGINRENRRIQPPSSATNEGTTDILSGIA